MADETLVTVVKSWSRARCCVTVHRNPGSPTQPRRLVLLAEHGLTDGQILALALPALSNREARLVAYALGLRRLEREESAS
jgi:hypothetical protein